MSWKINYLFALLVLILGSCVYPVELEQGEFKELLVVDGILTDAQEPSLVRLRYSTPINTVESRNVVNAEVKIRTQDGNEIFLEELEEGNYYTPTNFQAVAGTEYQLIISTAEGKSYESEPQTLVASPPIERIYNRFNELPSSDENSVIRGLEFLIDSKSTTTEPLYFRYTWDQVYEIRMPFPSLYDYDVQTFTSTYRTEPVGVCYPTEQSSQLIISTTQNSASNNIVDFPIRFVTENEPDLKVKYSILVKQRSISKPAYEYYSRLRQNIEASGSLIDKQQGAIIGNITSVDDPFEQVVGYFEVAGVSELRTTFITTDLDPEYQIPAAIGYCVIGDNILEDNAFRFRQIARSNDAIRIVNIAPSGAITYGPRECTDCSYFATTEAPDFW